MSLALKTKVSGFQFVQGTSQAGAPNSLVVERGAEIPSQSMKGNLYLLVEFMNRPAGPDPLATQLAQVIRKTYFSTHGSITSSLRAALNAANQFLLDHNMKASPEEQRDGSVCCLVLRGEDAFIARAGPCAAYHIRGTRWERFPPASPDMAPASAPLPLGLRKEPEIALHHAQIAPGDLLMLIDSRGAPILAQTPIQGPAEAAATAALRNAAQQADFSTLLIEISGEPSAAAQPAAEAPRRERPKPAAAAVARGKPARAAKAAAAETSLAKPAAPKARRAARARVEPAEAEAPAKAKGRRLGSWSIVALALLVPLLVIGAIWGFNWYQQRQIDRAFQNSLALAQRSYTTAKTTTDKDIARASLEEAKARLKEALAIRAEDAQALQLQRDLQALDDKIRQVTPLYSMFELYSFAEPGSEPRRLAVSGRDIYVLDKRHSIVTRHVLNEVGDSLERGQEAIEVVRKGQLVGNVVVGNLVDLAWIPAGGERKQDSLVILDASGYLITYNKDTGLSAQELPERMRFKSPWLIDYFAGAKLYILDSSANQIYRYVPTKDGYTIAPENYFPDDVQVDLRNVRDMAINGDIWLLFPDRIMRYTAGRPVSFELKGLDMPFSSPAGLFAGLTDGLSPTNYLYIADTGNGRIVKLTKEGQFAQQFRPAEGSQFQELSDLYVDEAASRTFFLAGTALYVADIPKGE